MRCMYSYDEFTVDRIQVFEEKVELVNETGYNVGDLLNMPSFFSTWSKRNHNMRLHAQKFIHQLPNSIVARYYQQEDGNENTILPNIPLLQKVTDEFIQDNTSFLYDDLENDHVLFVHVRAGDRGNIHPDFILAFQNMIQNYEKIILLVGIHQWTHSVSAIHEYKKNLLLNIENLCRNCDTSKIFIDTNEPDIHLTFMRKCRNLLIHRTGFSHLGAFLHSGKLFITSVFFLDYCQDKKYFEETLHSPYILI